MRLRFFTGLPNTVDPKVNNTNTRFGTPGSASTASCA